MLKLDAITSCVIEEDDNAVLVFGGSVIGKHTREIMPIREWFKMVVLYTPRLFSYKVSTVNIGIIRCDGRVVRVRCKFHLQRFAILCHFHLIDNKANQNRESSTSALAPSSLTAMSKNTCEKECHNTSTQKT